MKHLHYFFAILLGFSFSFPALASFNDEPALGDTIKPVSFLTETKAGIAPLIVAAGGRGQGGGGGQGNQGNQDGDGDGDQGNQNNQDGDGDGDRDRDGDRGGND